MEITVNYFGNFRYITNKKAQHFWLPEGTTVGNLLSSLVREYKQFKNLLYRGESLNRDIIIVRNSRRINSIEDSLRDKDEILLLVGMAGG